MKKKKTFSIKLNKTKKSNKNVVLLVIASIVAAATAVFGILKYKGKKAVDDESKKTVYPSEPQEPAESKESSARDESGTQEPQKPSRLEHCKINPGELDWETLAKEKEAEQIRKGEIPEHMLRKVKKSKRGAWGRKWKIALSSIAMLLAVAVVCGNIAQYLRPAEAVAKESFTGIGKIVEEHGEDNPYKILDIVPSKVTISTSNLDGTTGSGSTTTPDPDNPVSTAFTFTTGTMGYLAGGKVPFTDELETAFKSNPIFNHHASRVDLFNKLIPSPNSFPQIKYTEAYGGVSNVSETNGWTLLFPSRADTDICDDTGKYDQSKMSEGIFKGAYERYVSGDKTGFDFVSIDGTAGNNLNISGLSNKFVYIYFEGNESDPPHWFPVDIATYYASYLPNGTPAYMPKADEVRKITFSDQGPNCSANDYVYKFDGQIYLPVNPAEKVEELYHRIPTSGTSGQPTESTEGEGSTPPEETPGPTEGEGSTPPEETPGPAEGEGSTPPEETTDTSTTPPEETQTEEQDSDTNTVAVLDNKSTLFEGNWRRLVEGDGTGDSSGNEGGEGTGDGSGSGEGGGTGDGSGSGEGGGNGEGSGSGEGGGSGDGSGDGSGSGEGNGNGDSSGNEGGDGSGSGEGSGNEGGDGSGSGEGDGTGEGSGSGEGGGNGETTQPTQPSEGNGTPNTEYSGEETEYYVIDASAFVTIGPEELAAMLANDSVEADEAEDENGIMILADVNVQAPNDKFVYLGPGMGDYKLTASNEGDFIGVYNAPIYFRCQAGNDWLRQYVFNSLSGGDNANSSFRVEVTTVRADEVTSDMVYEADLVYMESGQNIFLNTGLPVSYIQHAEDDSLLGDVNDMDAGVVSAILSRASDDLMPVIMDYAVTEDENYADTNYQLLAKALLKRDLADFYDAMNEGTNLMANLRMNLGNGSDDDSNLDFPNKYSNNFNYSYVNQNIYVLKNEPLVSDNFADYFDDFTANAGFGDVLAAIMAENSTLAEEDRITLEVSKARAIQYIINFSVGIMGEFDDLTILELQPTANIDSVTGGVSSDLHIEVDSKDNTKLYWKTESMKTGKQILYSKKPFSVTTDVKSVVEFNGEWEDINGTYDMIFIGLDGMNLNLGNDRLRRPIYNNEKLNGKVYHTGDNANSGTYDSNDITSQKMMDLLEYLQAGYPIVVENDCFKDGTARRASGDSINTEYIGEDTLMYRFLSAAVSGDEYKDSIFTVSDTMSSALFMARMRTSKPRVELLDADNLGSDQGSEANQGIGKVQYLTLDENDEYHGTIAYQIRNDRGEEYLGNTIMHLYADMNYDGVFGAEEELTEYVNDGNVIDVGINGMGPGIVPWKLEVADIGNEYRRHSVQGYFKLLSSNEEQVRVLQVTTKKGDYSIDLEQMYRTDNSMLARYIKDAESNSNLAFEFESITPDILSTRLGENAKYLNQWDVVVLTVDNNVAVDTEAFTAYINEGRSLLVCNQNKNGNSAGLTSETLGWSEGRTFVSLGASNLHRYANLKDDMYGAQHGNLKAEKINEGSILYYPYQLDGNTFNFGNTESGLRASEYLLDFEDNLKSNPTQAYVTTWLTLGGGTNTAYGLSPRDARNNYYCYSKGNVVYLAQSEYHYTYDVANNEIPEGKEGSDECKFFVNALMAAYSAGVHGSDVSIVSGFAKTSTPMKSISVPFDQEWRDTADDGTGGILDNTVDVYFKFADSNIGANKHVTVSFYYEDPAGEKEFAVGDEIVKATAFGSEIWTVTDNKLVPVTANDQQNPDRVDLVPGKVYQIKAPVVSLRTLTDDKTNDAGIYVLVESEFTRTGKTYKIDGFGTVSLNRAKLFLLE